MLRRFWNDIILLNLNEFDNIGINFYINVFLFVICVGLCVLAFFYDRQRNMMYLVVKQLIRHEATSAEGAKKLSELGLDRGGIRRILGAGSMLKNAISTVGVDEYTYEEYIKLGKEERKKAGKIDFSVVSFYIPEQKKSCAEKIVAEYKSSTLKLVCFCLLILLLYFCICSFSFELIGYIDSLLA